MSARAQILAYRAVALLAVAAAMVTGAIMALTTAPRPVLSARTTRIIRHPTTIMLDAGGRSEPVATVIPPANPPPPDEPAWPPPLLNPDAHLRAGWDLSMGRPNAREILFSFDDGPNPGTTDRLLGMLEHARIHAVFFVCGWRLEAEEPLRSRAREILRDIVAHGHIVGNHTVHHRVLPQLSQAQIAYEIDHNADLIEETIHQRPHLFRPPYGAYSEDVRRHAAMRGYELWMWSIDPHDYEHVGDSALVAQLVINNIANHAGGTVLLHDTHPWSVTAFPKIVQWIQETNREREAQHRAPYVVMDAPRYLMGARERLPMIQAAEEAALAASEHHGRRDASVAVEPTTGVVAEAPTGAAPTTPRAP